MDTFYKLVEISDEEIILIRVENLVINYIRYNRASNTRIEDYVIFNSDNFMKIISNKVLKLPILYVHSWDIHEKEYLEILAWIDNHQKTMKEINKSTSELFDKYMLQKQMIL